MPVMPTTQMNPMLMELFGGQGQQPMQNINPNRGGWQAEQGQPMQQYNNPMPPMMSVPRQGPMGAGQQQPMGASQGVQRSVIDDLIFQLMQGMQPRQGSSSRGFIRGANPYEP